MERLGDKLKRIEAAVALREVPSKTADQAAAEAAERQRHEAVRQQFKTWKWDITAAIERGELPPPLRVAAVARPGGRSALLISSRDNPDHDIFAALRDWAIGEGLAVKVQRVSIFSADAQLTITSA